MNAIYSWLVAGTPPNWQTALGIVAICVAVVEQILPKIPSRFVRARSTLELLGNLLAPITRNVPLVGAATRALATPAAQMIIADARDELEQRTRSTPTAKLGALLPLLFAVSVLSGCTWEDKAFAVVCACVGGGLLGVMVLLYFWWRQPDDDLIAEGQGEGHEVKTGPWPHGRDPWDLPPAALVLVGFLALGSVAHAAPLGDVFGADPDAGKVATLDGEPVAQNLPGQSSQVIRRSSSDLSSYSVANVVTDAARGAELYDLYRDAREHEKRARFQLAGTLGDAATVLHAGAEAIDLGKTLVARFDALEAKLGGHASKPDWWAVHGPAIETALYVAGALASTALTGIGVYESCRAAGTC